MPFPIPIKSRISMVLGVLKQPPLQIYSTPSTNLSTEKGTGNMVSSVPDFRYFCITATVEKGHKEALVVLKRLGNGR